jgi:hypothetical protein
MPLLAATRRGNSKRVSVQYQEYPNSSGSLALQEILMAVTEAEAREIARRFLSVYGFAPTDNDDTVIDWNVVLTRFPVSGQSPRNFARNLIIMIIRHFLNDPDAFIAAPTWNKHFKDLEANSGAQQETIAVFIQFLLEIL